MTCVHLLLPDTHTSPYLQAVHLVVDGRLQPALLGVYHEANLGCRERVSNIRYAAQNGTAFEGEGVRCPMQNSAMVRMSDIGRKMGQLWMVRMSDIRCKPGQLSQQ